jgi:glycosyltransferase involved in cell wall biosynthesis
MRADFRRIHLRESAFIGGFIAPTPGNSQEKLLVSVGVGCFNEERMSLRAKKVSVVIPVYNEAENMEPLCVELRQALEPLGVETEWVFVDDGSSDDSVARLQELRHRFPAIRIVKLRRNFGQTAAMQAGFDRATGDFIVSLDADLQNDPQDIPSLLRRLEEGYDLVCGWRKNRRDPAISRNLPSKIANWMIRKTIGNEIHDNGCSLKAYRADLVRSFRLYSDMHRFIPAVAAMSGARIGELVVNHRPRKYGSSKYGISRTFKVLSDLLALKLITRFGSKPLIGFFALASPFCLMGFFLLFLALWNRLGSQAHPMRVVNEGVALMSIATGCFLMLLGLVGEVTISVTRASLDAKMNLMYEEARGKNDAD